MEKLYFVLILVFPLLALSCKNQKINTVGDSYANTYQELKEFIEKPDSLLTQNERIKRDKLFNLILEKVIIRDNQFSTTATHKDFTDEGLSKYYYDILKISIKETNQWVKEEGIENLDIPEEYNKVGMLHNEGLEYIFEEIKAYGIEYTKNPRLKSRPFLENKDKRMVGRYVEYCGKLVEFSFWRNKRLVE